MNQTLNIKSSLFIITKIVVWVLRLQSKYKIMWRVIFNNQRKEQKLFFFKYIFSLLKTWASQQSLLNRIFSLKDQSGLQAGQGSALIMFLSQHLNPASADFNSWHYYLLLLFLHLLQLNWKGIFDMSGLGRDNLAKCDNATENLRKI